MNYIETHGHDRQSAHSTLESLLCALSNDILQSYMYTVFTLRQVNLCKYPHGYHGNQNLSIILVTVATNITLEDSLLLYKVSY